MPVPKFSPRSYYEAAQDHLAMTDELLARRQYFVAHYFAGIAVEAILRALSVAEGEPFDGTHHLEHWARRANLIPHGSEKKRDEFRGAVDEINTRWRSNQRYYTVKMLDTYLESTQLDKIRGDRVKYSSKRLYELATIVVEAGVQKWNSNKRSSVY